MVVVEVVGWVPPAVIAAELTRRWWIIQYAVMNVSSSSCCLDAKYYATSNNSPPFDNFASYSTNPYKSPGEMVPFFTTAQWKQLERQSMIYKYMISSVPVPPHLLYPPLHSSLSSLYNLGYSKNGAALEAGRCKRTDGKKWRCSRNVAPHQKYCERHLHRGRPRSRKPVEKVNNKNNGDENHKKPPRLQQTPKQYTTANDEQPLLLLNAKTDLSSISTAPSHKGTNRDLGSTMESEMVSFKEWQHLLESNMGFANEGSSIYGCSAVFHQDYNVDDQQPLDNVLSYSNFFASEIDPPIGFMDAWSIDNNMNNTTNNNNVNHENFFPWLNLSIAMTGGNHVLDGEMGNVQMRDGVGFFDEDPRLLNPVCCWEAFGPGGPLAEALCVNPLSPHGSISDPTTNVSSPSGVLHRTLFSHSDGSVCSSPSEVAFQRIM